MFQAPRDGLLATGVLQLRRVWKQKVCKVTAHIFAPGTAWTRNCRFFWKQTHLNWIIIRSTIFIWAEYSNVTKQLLYLSCSVVTKDKSGRVWRSTKTAWGIRVFRETKTGEAEVRRARVHLGVLNWEGQEGHATERKKHYLQLLSCFKCSPISGPFSDAYLQTTLFSWN